MQSYRRPAAVRFFHHHARVFAWLWAEVCPRCVVLAALGVMITMMLVTIGESPSGPAAELSAFETSCHSLLSQSSSFAADPGPCTQASRVGQDQFPGRAGQLAVAP